MYKLIYGNSNPELFSKIVKELNTTPVKADVTTFSDSESRVIIHESIRGQTVFALQSFCTPINDNIMEFLIMLDALKRASAQQIIAIIPYYAYARQDRKMDSREPITAKLMADLLQKAGADRVMTLELHSGQIQGFFDIPVDNLNAVKVFAEYFLKKNLRDLVIVSPDTGGVARARKLAELLNAPLAIIDKRRPNPNVVEVMNVIGEVAEKNCIIYDDMIDTAGTMCKAAAALKKMGAKSVCAAATHGIFSGKAFENIASSEFDEVIVTDSLPLKEKSDKIKQLSIASLLAQSIQLTSDNNSLKKLF